MSTPLTVRKCPNDCGNFYDAQLIRDSPFNSIIVTPARNTVNNTRIRASISRRPVPNMADTPHRKATKHANSPKGGDFGTFSTYSDRRFVLSDADLRSFSGHPALTNSGLALNRPIRSRSCRKSVLDTTTSAIWNTTYLECLTTLAPILIS